jgi:GNAT superfamily N-acetyltransferase
MIIQPARDSDVNEVVDLLCAQMAEHAIDMPREGVARAVAGMIQDPRRGAILVARLEGRIAGVAFISFTWSLEHAGLTAWLEELYVRPELRSRGTGGALLACAQDLALRAGCAAMDLEVTTDHSRAANLYQRDGFRELPRARWVKRLG